MQINRFSAGASASAGPGTGPGTGAGTGTGTGTGAGTGTRTSAGTGAGAGKLQAQIAQTTGPVSLPLYNGLELEQEFFKFLSVELACIMNPNCSCNTLKKMMNWLFYSILKQLGIKISRTL
jgi:hypothetical protein